MLMPACIAASISDISAKMYEPGPGKRHAVKYGVAHMVCSKAWARVPRPGHEASSLLRRACACVA